MSSKPYEDMSKNILDREIANNEMPGWKNGEDIVISGISGRFPESDSMEEFQCNLFNKVDLITIDSRRWVPGLFGLPGRHGKLKDISKFDAAAFGVNTKQADTMDPQLRILLEVVYEAIFDSGYSPNSLRGKYIGVFVGQCINESEEALTSDADKIDSYCTTGSARAMMANRISFAFDFKGPSFSIDSACSSSLYAFQQAMVALRTNQCEAAIVAGVNITMNPAISLQFLRLGMLSMEGKCRSFDAAGDGYVRSEAVSAILLQKVSEARRVYATVIHAKTNTDGFKNEGVTYPSGAMQKQLLQQVYKEAKIDPRDVSYVEAHGTGTKVGDPEELDAVTAVFCKERIESLPIGSIKSNMGHSEGSSGICSIAKILIAMETGVIPPNLHFNTPNQSIKGLVDGSLKVIDSFCKLTPGSLVGINSFGFGGANAHVILKGKSSTSAPDLQFRKIPRLAIYCGRTEETADYIFQKLNKGKYSDESITLLEESSKTLTTIMPFRGYALLNSGNEVLNKEIKYISSGSRPVWFLCSGMGSQWPCMAKEMLELDLFAKYINRSAGHLKEHDYDLINLLRCGSEEDLSTPTACFCSIVAVQIALIDVLRDLGITPDGMFGHSLGEFACSYADGNLTAEQLIMTAYCRGQLVEQAKLPIGRMAAVGLSWEEAKRRCPENVFPACNNADDSVTISGSIEKVKHFVEELTNEGIFAREVNSCNVAFHSIYVYPLIENLTKAMEKIIPNPKPRTSRWISSSIPEECWNQKLAQFSSPAYHVNNLVSPVLFKEALAHVPKNAIVIEIAPHGLLQAIVKRSLGSECSYVSLMKRKYANNVEFFLSAIGKLVLDFTIGK